MNLLCECLHFYKLIMKSFKRPYELSELRNDYLKDLEKYKGHNESNLLITYYLSTGT